MLGRLRIRTKLLLVVLVPLLAMLVVAVAGFVVLREARIGGDRYATISRSNALVADVLPPPAFIVEAYLTAEQLSAAEDSAVPGLLGRLSKQRLKYAESIARWTTEETDPEIRTALLADADRPAQAFFALVDEEFLPAIRAGDRALAASLVNGSMRQAFEEHREAITRVDELASARADRVEQDANDFVKRAITVLIAAVVIALVGALVLGVVVARAIVRPVNALRRVAMEELPATLDRLRAADADDVGAVEVPSVELGTRDELNDAATSFNEVIGTAVGLAADQSKLRRHMTDLMVNLGRRNQVLLGSQLDMLDRMESTVDEPELLDGLFELDHLAARMRRNAESLLVLAGSRRTRSWSEPVLLSEVIQGAVSELSDFRRVDVVVPGQDDVPVSGQHTVDVAHILAELIENALQFSSPSTRVVVRTQRPKQGLRVWISDLGIGMTEDELVVANTRVSRPPEIDELNADQVGFQVVARLSRRLGALVRMQPHPAGGLAVAVDLPPAVFASDEQLAPSPSLRSAPSARPTPAPRPRPVEPTPSPVPTASLPQRSSPPASVGSTVDGLPQRRRSEPQAPGELPRRAARTEAAPAAEEPSFQLFNSRSARPEAGPRGSLGDFARASRQAGEVAGDGPTEGSDVDE